MDIDPRLFVEIHPMETERRPRPDPIEDGGFDPSFVYKVIGMYNPSETSECYFVLVNPKRQIWFIPQRHLLAYKLIDSDEFYLPKVVTDTVPGHSPAGSASADVFFGNPRAAR